jgi:hypothetical protein
LRLLCRFHEYTDDKKIHLAVLEFDEYVVSWWDNAVSLLRDKNMVPILTWCDMKAKTRHCFVPPNYTWSLYDNLTNLTQGLKPIDEYYQEMELIMQHAKVRDPAEQQFLSGLTYQILCIVCHHPYHDMAQLLHQAREAETSVAEEAKSSRPPVTRSLFFMDIISWIAYCWYTRFSERGMFQGTHISQVRCTCCQVRGASCHEWF